LEHRPDQPVNVTNLTPSVTDQLLHSVINAEYRGYIL